MPPVIYADLRCLQDKDYQHRGIGYHTSALLRARTDSRFADWKTVGLLDARMPELPAEFLSLIDEVTFSLNPPLDGMPAIYLDGSPMTHDTRFGLRFQNHPAVLNAAVLYDFIPLDWPGYLPTSASRIGYFAKLARLSKFQLFFPISEYTASRLGELMGVTGARVKVTGACVRRSLYEIRDRLGAIPSAYNRKEPYFVTLGGDDRRKNTNLAVRAVRHLNLLYGRKIPLKAIGFYSLGYRAELLHLAGHGEGEGFLEFHPGTTDELRVAGNQRLIERWTRPSISDEEVVSLHAEAIAAIAPSHIEGFSLPVVEASVCGCPVVASTCAAQMELVTQHDALFRSDDAGSLAGILEHLLLNPERRRLLAAEQAHLGLAYHEAAVGKRFWDGIAEHVAEVDDGGAAKTARKPQVAFLSPCLPGESEAAFYTSMAAQDGDRLFDSAVFTDAVRPLSFNDKLRDSGKVSVAPFLSGRYDRIVSVLGNSLEHKRIFDVFERYGGPCILHDLRLLEIYYQRLGTEGFVQFASDALKRPVRFEDTQAWLRDPDLPFLFLSRIVDRAAPLIVRTRTQQDLIEKEYGVHAEVVTCCPATSFSDDELQNATRQAVRADLGISPGIFLISVFDEISRTSGMDVCILAIELLRSWSIPAELYFVGDSRNSKGEIDRISQLYEIPARVHANAAVSSREARRRFLLASDASVHLRTSHLGQVSRSLIDSIAAGLPAIATQGLANGCDAPDTVLRVPDRFSPLQVAEQLALTWEARDDRQVYTEERHAYLAGHNFEVYSQRLAAILGIA